LNKKCETLFTGKEGKKIIKGNYEKRHDAFFSLRFLSLNRTEKEEIFIKYE